MEFIIALVILVGLAYVAKLSFAKKVEEVEPAAPYKVETPVVEVTVTPEVVAEAKTIGIDVIAEVKEGVKSAGGAAKVKVTPAKKPAPKAAPAKKAPVAKKPVAKAPVKAPAKKPVAKAPAKKAPAKKPTSK